MIFAILVIFFYPDFTVGFGIAPNRALLRSRTLPPIGNFTLPRRHFYSVVPIKDISYIEVPQQFGQISEIFRKPVFCWRTLEIRRHLEVR